MAWFKRESGDLNTSGEKTVRTEGLWVKCENCRQIIWKKDLEENQNVCPKCDKHFRIDARTRLAQLLDDDQYEVFDSNLVSTDPLKFVDLKAYSSRLKQAKKDTGLKDAIINAHGKLNGRPVIVSAMEYSFIGGSMGAVVGEAITRAVEKATETRTPIIIISASGGARMMEGAISLMQMPRTVIATRLVKDAGLPFIVVLTDPTTGGVTASFAMLGDIQRLVVGDALSAGSRERLIAWLLACKTGGKRLRAGLPSDWRVGDKTGGGNNGTANDIAVAWPPGRAPILVAVYFTGSTIADDARSAVIADAGRIAITGL